VEFLLAIVEHFRDVLQLKAQRANSTGIRRFWRGSIWPKLSARRVVSYQPFFVSEN